MSIIDQSPIRRVWGTLETQTPFMQTYPGGEDTTGLKNLKYTRTWHVAGARIPVISGDSMRARLRRAVAFDLLERCGIEAGELDVATAHVLFVGGALSGNEAKGSSSYLAEIRSTLPSVALFGGTLLGDFAAGRLRMGSWVSQTAQTPSPALHGDVDVEQLPDAKALLAIEDFARNGGELTQMFSPEKRASDLGYGGVTPEDVFAHLTSEEQKRVPLEKIAKAMADFDGNDAISMPHAYQVVLPGARFAGWTALAGFRWSAEGDDAVQRSCLRHAIDTALPHGQEVTLGLRASNGYGVVGVEWEDLDAISPSGDAYVSHVEDHRDDIRGMLTSGILKPTIDPERVAKKFKPKSTGNTNRPKGGKGSNGQEAPATVGAGTAAEEGE